MDLRFTVIASLIVLAAFSRIITHMPNFSPLAAIGIFGAAYFQKMAGIYYSYNRYRLSDLFINNVIYAQHYKTFTWFYSGFYWQYGSYLLITFVSFSILKKVNIQRVLFASLISTILFFAVTNFACYGSYPQNLNGLVSCYAAGIPFIKGTLLGDLFYCAVLFGTFELAQKESLHLKLTMHNSQ
ncbi:MAG: hypothetical protein IPJ79_07550 [Bacteroidetes bacterium]|nr:hypothetical protein [Bacteroidota bacterium]